MVRGGDLKVINNNTFELIVGVVPKTQIMGIMDQWGDSTTDLSLPWKRHWIYVHFFTMRHY